MDYTNIPPTILRLMAASHLRWFFDRDDESDRPIRTVRMRDLHARALGPGRRKRSGHFEPRDEREVRDWLRLHQLTLFVPSADAALQSLIEARVLPKPDIGKRYSVYAMLPGDQIVALVRQDTDIGRQILEGRIELAYNAEAQVIAAGIADPTARIRSAAILDTHALVDQSIIKVEL